MRIITAFLVGAFAPFLFACGSTTSGNGPGDAGTGADSSVADGGCGTPPPGAVCATGCNGGSTGMVCENGQWQCPPIPLIECVFDAGQDSAPTDAATDSGHDGGDAAAPGDGGLLADGGLACGASTCDPTTSYCQVDNGLHFADGGTGSSHACTALPAACDGGASCACIVGSCACTDDAGGVTVTCNFP